ncbi:MAG TPA: glucose 1-dehydrogenase [Acidimicrobiales bacterium]|jgi:3alpha(or 20beta)-hydroxysteroid dehydrogenase|nr:glucose 1-dehydrogenase [Acidimicrobiales bacterium]
MGRLDGRVTIVTGAARGQGEAEARLFAAEGARVLLTDVLDADGTAAAASIGTAAAYAHLDVRSADEWSAAVSACVERFGPPTVLVNNAGVLPIGSILECDEATFRRTLDINLTGAFLGIKAVAPAMTAAGGGSIVNISSVAALVGRAGYAAYGTSKWGLRGLTKIAALELGHSGIRVNSIHPGAVDTPMTTSESTGLSSAERDAQLAHLPIPRWAQPREIAQLALFLASDESSYSTGSEFVADGGRSAGT